MTHTDWFRLFKAACFVVGLGTAGWAAGSASNVQLSEGNKWTIELSVPSDGTGSGAITGSFVFSTGRVTCKGDLVQATDRPPDSIVMNQILRSGDCAPNCVIRLADDFLGYVEGCPGSIIGNTGRFDRTKGVDILRRYAAAKSMAAELAVTTELAPLAEQLRALESSQRIGHLSLPTPSAAEVDKVLAYAIELGNSDVRMLYPPRIAQQAPRTLVGWMEAVGFARLKAATYGASIKTLDALGQKLASAAEGRQQSPAAISLYAQIDSSRALMFSLLAKAAAGDPVARASYRELAERMASTPFTKDLFEAATLRRALDAELKSSIESKETDVDWSWRFYAIKAIANASDSESALSALQSVQRDARRNGAEYALLDNVGRMIANSPSSSTSGESGAQQGSRTLHCTPVLSCADDWTDFSGNRVKGACVKIRDDCN